MGASVVLVPGAATLFDGFVYKQSVDVIASPSGDTVDRFERRVPFGDRFCVPPSLSEYVRLGVAPRPRLLGMLDKAGAFPLYRGPVADECRVRIFEGHSPLQVDVPVIRRGLHSAVLPSSIVLCWKSRHPAQVADTDDVVAVNGWLPAMTKSIKQGRLSFLDIPQAQGLVIGVPRGFFQDELDLSWDRNAATIFAWEVVMFLAAFLGLGREGGDWRCSS